MSRRQPPTCNQRNLTQEVSTNLRYCFPIYTFCTLLFLTSFHHMLMRHKSHWLQHLNALYSGRCHSFIPQQWHDSLIAWALRMLRVMEFISGRLYTLTCFDCLCHKHFFLLLCVCVLPRSVLWLKWSKLNAFSEHIHSRHGNCANLAYSDLFFFFFFF